MATENDDEQNTRIKRGIQNILGGLVLISLPVVALALIGMWSTIGIHTLKLEHQDKEHAANLEHQRKEYASLLRRVLLLEKFKSKTDSDRFRASDGSRLERKIERLATAQHTHDKEAEGWITVIKRIQDEIGTIKSVTEKIKIRLRKIESNLKKWVERIERNTGIVERNRESRHSHGDIDDSNTQIHRIYRN